MFVTEATSDEAVWGGQQGKVNKRKQARPKIQRDQKRKKNGREREKCGTTSDIKKRKRDANPRPESEGAFDKKNQKGKKGKG